MILMNEENVVFICSAFVFSDLEEVTYVRQDKLKRVLFAFVLTNS